MQAIPKYEGLYSITNDGRIFSHRKDRYLATRQHPRGYLHVALYKQGKMKNHLVHRLMAETYLAKELGRGNVNHKNFDKTDNRLDNLEWCTQHENIRHAIANGHFATKGGRKSALKPGDAQEILDKYATGTITQSQLAKDYSVSQGLIWLIVHRKRYI